MSLTDILLRLIGQAPARRSGPTVSLAFLGDVMLARGVEARAAQDGPEGVLADLRPVLETADARIANLECVLSTRGERWNPERKSCHFRADPGLVSALTAVRIGAVSLANNHTMDYGPDALIETLDVLDRAGIARAGAGRDDEEAFRPALFSAGTARVALVAFTDNWSDLAAGPGRPGVAWAYCRPSEPTARRLLAAIAEARRHSDLLVVSAHWGGNWGDSPHRHHRRLARALFRAGADIVFGHSPHITRGVRFARGRVVMFSAGDIVDDYGIRPPCRNDLAFVFRVEMENGRVVRMLLTPTAVREARATWADAADAATVVARMIERCRTEGTGAAWNAGRSELLLTP